MPATTYNGVSIAGVSLEVITTKTGLRRLRLRAYYDAKLSPRTARDLAAALLAFAGDEDATRCEG